jgi:threonine/homoserine/homoserine lactone efflux protein
MSNPGTNEDAKKTFEPLVIVGVFWSVFGVIVLFATLFVNGTERVPQLHGVVTNLIAGILLLGVGVISILRGRANLRRRGLER